MAKEKQTETMVAGTDVVAMKKVKDKGKKAIEKKAQSLTRLVVEYVSVTSIKPNSYNPNRQDPHAFELLLKSMTEDGFTQPVVVQRATREIVDGEHRWRAAQHIGLTEIPVVFTDMTPEQMRIATLRHNRARGDEDIELTSQVLRDLRELGALEWAQDSLMMDSVEMDRLLNEIPAPDALAGEEYSEAWNPEKGGKEGTADSGQIGAGHTVSGTPQALLKAREQEAAIAAAKTDEEKKAAARDHKVYRLAFMFAGEEAEVVKAALGDQPALRVLEWARREVGAEKPSSP